MLTENSVFQIRVFGHTNILPGKPAYKNTYQKSIINTKKQSLEFVQVNNNPVPQCYLVHHVVFILASWLRNHIKLASLLLALIPHSSFDELKISRPVIETFWRIHHVWYEIFWFLLLFSPVTKDKYKINGQERNEKYIICCHIPHFLDKL